VVEDVCLLPLACWDCGSESRRGRDISLLRVLCVVRSDNSSRGVLTSVVCLSEIVNPRQCRGLDPVGLSSHENNKLKILRRRLCIKILPLYAVFLQSQQTVRSPFTFTPVSISFHSYFTLWPLLPFCIHLGTLSGVYKKPTCCPTMQKSERKIMWVRSQAVFPPRTCSILCFIYKVLLFGSRLCFISHVQTCLVYPLRRATVKHWD